MCGSGSTCSDGRRTVKWYPELIVGTVCTVHKIWPDANPDAAGDVEASRSNIPAVSEEFREPGSRSTEWSECKSLVVSAWTEWERCRDLYTFDIKPAAELWGSWSLCTPNHTVEDPYRHDIIPWHHTQQAWQSQNYIFDCIFFFHPFLVTCSYLCTVHEGKKMLLRCFFRQMRGFDCSFVRMTSSSIKQRTHKITSSLYHKKTAEQ